jgi:hypothetical protein
MDDYTIKALQNTVASTVTPGVSHFITFNMSHCFHMLHCHIALICYIFNMLHWFDMLHFFDMLHCFCFATLPHCFDMLHIATLLLFCYILMYINTNYIAQ